MWGVTCHGWSLEVVAWCSAWGGPPATDIAAKDLRGKKKDRRENWSSVPAQTCRPASIGLAFLLAPAAICFILIGAVMIDWLRSSSSLAICLAHAPLHMISLLFFSSLSSYASFQEDGALFRPARTGEYGAPWRGEVRGKGSKKQSESRPVAELYFCFSLPLALHPC